ncbi:MAG: SDR family NAD(P)-dependent oxidoreductase, partial [Verrucomicrobia bacterium]|nr:SDR family NAD(P)-dependent oxidoreductase [Verrucomicrobiota bacterium]
PELKQRFDAGEFAAVVKRIDILTGNANTLPDWFFRKIWRRKEGVDSGLLNGKGQALVFLDQMGLGNAICAELDQKFVSVEVGPDFAKINPSKYRINPKTREHYRLLFESLHEDKIQVDQILHLWTYDEAVEEISSLEMLEEAQEPGVYSLLFLIQSLVEVQGSEYSVRLLCISSHTQPVAAEDEIAYEKSPVLGLIKTIAREMPGLNCRHIDLHLDSIEANTDCIIREIQKADTDLEVAYRNGLRYIPRLEKIDPRQNKEPGLPFKNRGMYLMSGGLGGIGTEVGRYLLQHYNARLLIVGRTSLPEKETWEHHVGQPGVVSERIKAYLELEKLGGEILYEKADICDLAQLRQVVDRARSRWKCDLDGILNLAGLYQENFLDKESRESFAAVLRPKVLGTWTLHELLKEHSASIFISFSSVSGFFGGATIGAYAAANSFLDTFSQYMKKNSSIKSHCFAWTQWTETGVSRGYSGMGSSSQALGYHSISVKQGLHSLAVGLLSEEAHFFVGLDDQKSHIQRHIEMESLRTEKLCAYFAAQTNGNMITKVEGLEVRDRFGRPSSCDFVQLKELPLMPGGNVDMTALSKLNGFGSPSERTMVVPQNALEQQLIKIWEEVLGIHPISVKDNFFELGGNSLQAVRIFSKIEKAFGKKLSLATPFQAPTIRQLADIFQKKGWSTPWTSLVPIQPDGSKPAFFCVAPLASTVLIYADLARHLGGDQPFYGLEPLGLDGEKEPQTKVEDMAAHYIKDIRMLMPEGPYFLGGGCFGGTVAFEMALQLKALGEQVVLVILDTVWPPLTEVTIKNPPKNYPFVIDRFDRVLSSSRKFHLGSLRPRQLISTVKKLFRRAGPTYHQNRIQRIMNAADYKPTHIQHVMNAHYLARLNYVAKVYPGRIILLQSPLGAQRESHLAWSELAAGGVDCHMVPGDHELLYEAPNVQDVAAKLRACLDEAQQIKQGVSDV